MRIAWGQLLFMSTVLTLTVASVPWAHAELSPSQVPASPGRALSRFWGTVAPRVGPSAHDGHRPEHPQECAHRHHQVDRRLEPLQHNEGDDSHRQGEDVKPRYPLGR